MSPAISHKEELRIAREGLVLARQAVAKGEGSGGADSPGSRLHEAKRAMRDAEAQLSAGNARPSLMWSCKAVQHACGFTSVEYAAAQAKYDIVYNSHLLEG